MPSNAFAPPAYGLISEAPDAARVTYLRRVALLTLAGLTLTGVSSLVSAMGLIAIGGPQGGLMSLVGILGPWLFASVVCQRMVFSDSATTRWAGFVMGAVAEGMAFAFILLIAAAFSYSVYGNPLIFIGQAMGITAVSVLAMTAWMMTGPKEIGGIKTIMKVASIPLLIAMGISFVFPSLFGGPIGLVIAVVFVAASVLGMVWRLQEVVHEYRTDMVVAGAFGIMLGILALLWNVINLLMAFNRR